MRQSLHAGFTLIELLIVIALIAIIGSGVFAVGQRFLVNNAMKNKTNELVSALRTAQLNTMSGKEDSQWGVSVSSSSISQFKGSSYSGRDAAFDVTYTIPNNVSISTDDVIFERGSGNPDAGATFTLTGTNMTTTVTVNSLGVVDVN
jgi:prepilin-type N-terminal cleavage/methylation domain-containing protein